MIGQAADRRGAGRATRPASYAILFALFASIVIPSHLWLARLPYFWDEAGQFIPAALDILHGGRLIPRSTVPNIHPPLLAAYLAGVWRLAGFDPAVTRMAMLLVASCGVLAAFLLAVELARGARGTPAFLAAALLCVSPLFFAQSELAQLDLPAMLFTALALRLFLQNRIPLSAGTCVVLVLVKETGMVVPLVFAAWLAVDRRWRDAAWFVLPAAALGVWIAALTHTTGYWAGNVDFVRYNLLDPLHPVRLAVALARRLYFLFVANFHWVGALAILSAWRATPLFRSRAWRIAWTLLAAHVAMLTLFGGAVLNRYLLPVLPILFAAMALAITALSRIPRLTSSVLLLAGMAVCNWINPLYPFPFEENLAFRDFVELQREATDYLARWYAGAVVTTAWPMTVELARPELGFVDRPLRVQVLPNLAPETFARLDWNQVEIAAVFCRNWDPKPNLMRLAPVSAFWRRFYGDAPGASAEEARARIPFPAAAHFERRGQWVEIFANPAISPGKPMAGAVTRPIGPAGGTR